MNSLPEHSLIDPMIPGISPSGRWILQSPSQNQSSELFYGIVCKVVRCADQIQEQKGPAYLQKIKATFQRKYKFLVALRDNKIKRAKLNIWQRFYAKTSLTILEEKINQIIPSPNQATPPQPPLGDLVSDFKRQLEECTKMREAETAQRGEEFDAELQRFKATLKTLAAKFP